MVGVLTIGKPASPSLCVGICGVENAEYVYELNRLCVSDGLPKNTLSFFVASVLRMISDSLILVSYADTSQGHHGYIYQATNWIYTGISAKRTEWQEFGSNGHSKSLCDKMTIDEMKQDPTRFGLVDRPQKHRYVYFLGAKRKAFCKALQYPIQPYPKGDNARYDASFEPMTQGILFG